MADRFRVTKAWGLRFAQEKITLPTLLRRAGLPLNLFDHEKSHLTTAEIFALWRSVAAMAPAGFGLKLGTELRFERSHPLAIAGVCSRSFGDALQRLARYKQLTCPEEIRVHRKAQEASVEFFFIEAKEVQPDIMVDLGLSWILNVARRGSDEKIIPLRLELTRPVKHRALLERHFGCRVRFKANRNVLVFRSSDLDRPFVTQNEELLTIIGAHLDSELKARNASMNVGEQVKRSLKGSLAGQRPTLQHTAREMGLSTRTLQRRLTDADLTFQQLLEKARHELARHYLKHSAVELNEVAYLLGYEHANSFFRAFCVWEGKSPGEWRKAHRRA